MARRRRSLAAEMVDELLALAETPVTPEHPGALNLDGLSKGETAATEAFIRRNFGDEMADAMIDELRRRVPQPPAGAGREEG